MANSAKKEAWGWCSRYIRLRDALAYCNLMSIDISQFSRVEDLPVKCCTCNDVKSWIRFDAGHFFSRGRGGMSGVYFDERNINTQCKSCNGFNQGNAQVYREFILRKYGQEVIDELEFLHKNGSYKGKIIGMGLYYEREFKRLVESI